MHKTLSIGESDLYAPFNRDSPKTRICSNLFTWMSSNTAKTCTPHDRVYAQVSTLYHANTLTATGSTAAQIVPKRKAAETVNWASTRDSSVRMLVRDWAMKNSVRPV